MLGLLLPIGVWKGEERFGPGFLWTLPVDRRRHALAKVFAGWVWLMGAVALFVLWLLALALVLRRERARRGNAARAAVFLIRGRGPTRSGRAADVRWTPQPLLWLVPFTAATATYLLASALALGAAAPAALGHRDRVSASCCLVAARGRGERGLADRRCRPRAWKGSYDGPYGLDALLTARTESLQVAATLSTGETVVVWRALPDLAPLGDGHAALDRRRPRRPHGPRPRATASVAA